MNERRQRKLAKNNCINLNSSWHEKKNGHETFPMYKKEKQKRIKETENKIETERNRWEGDNQLKCYSRRARQVN